MTDLAHDGWCNTWNMLVERGYGVSVDVSVYCDDGVPSRVSVTFPEECRIVLLVPYYTAGVANAAVRQVLHGIGYTAVSWEWEAGEVDIEGVAFLHGVTKYAVGVQS